MFLQLKVRKNRTFLKKVPQNSEKSQKSQEMGGVKKKQKFTMQEIVVKNFKIRYKNGENAKKWAEPKIGFIILYWKFREN